jgi:hypothetical protein
MIVRRPNSDETSDIIVTPTHVPGIYLGGCPACAECGAVTIVQHLTGAPSGVCIAWFTSGVLPAERHVDDVLAPLGVDWTTTPANTLHPLVMSALYELNQLGDIIAAKTRQLHLANRPEGGGSVTDLHAQPETSAGQRQPGIHGHVAPLRVQPDPHRDAYDLDTHQALPAELLEQLGRLDIDRGYARSPLLLERRARAAIDRRSRRRQSPARLTSHDQHRTDDHRHGTAA